MRAAAVQLNSTEDKDRNLSVADRLVRAAAAAGAELVVLPEKFNVLGTHESYLAGAETLEGPTIGWARQTARELEIDLVAGSIVERREGHEKLGNTSVHVGPDGELNGVYRKIHMFDVTVGRKEYRESSTQEAGDEVVVSEARGVALGLTVCYDLRFPELFRILAVRGARVLVLPAAFTKVTGEAHWDVLLRARAIENQAFLIAADQVGVHPPDNESYGASQIVDPWGEVLVRAPDEECFVAADLDLARQDEVRRTLPSLANRVPSAYVWPDRLDPTAPAAERGHGPDERAWAEPMSTSPRSGAVEKRRIILDAAITVFARQGFHHCRVSDVADEAGVAYGLVYHYFDSKEEILNELFLERWQVMLDAIAEIDRLEDVPARDKLYMVAGFIIDSYRHEPDLMKVIIVEVTRAANSFGRIHLEKIREAYAGIAGIVESARRAGVFKTDISAEFAAMCFYGAIEQLLSGWIFDLLPQTDQQFEAAKGLVVDAICGGLEVTKPGAPVVSG